MTAEENVCLRARGAIAQVPEVSFMCLEVVMAASWISIRRKTKQKLLHNLDHSSSNNQIISHHLDLHH